MSKFERTVYEKLGQQDLSTLPLIFERPTGLYFGGPPASISFTLNASSFTQLSEPESAEAFYKADKTHWAPSSGPSHGQS